MELRLRVMAVADDVAEETGARNVGEWYAHAARVRPEDARADYRLARGLDRSAPKVAKALRRGQVNAAQARVIVRSVEELPDEAPTPVVVQAERSLVEHAQRFAPRPLARIGHHILSVIAPDLADEAEATRLAALEAEAHRQTRLNLRRLGGGTSKITGLVPDMVATRLATYLEAYANPRRDAVPPTGPLGEHADRAESADGQPVPAGFDPVARLSYPRRLGEAFCQLLESLDPHRLPVHGGDATSIVITIDYRTLLKDLGAADVIAGATIPSDPDTDPTTGRTDHRRRRTTARVHRETPPRRPERTLRDPRPRQSTTPLQRTPTKSTNTPRPDVPRGGMSHPRHLGRSPPLEPLAHRRAHRPRRRRTPLRPSPPPSPRPRLHG